MKYRFHPLAVKEFEEAIDFYEKKNSGLGSEFAEEVYAAIQRIIHFPNAWPEQTKKTRRCMIQRFPFGIIYSILESEIIIVAIMQLNRKSNY